MYHPSPLLLCANANATFPRFKRNPSNASISHLVIIISFVIVDLIHVCRLLYSKKCRFIQYPLHTLWYHAIPRMVDLPRICQRDSRQERRGGGKAQAGKVTYLLPAICQNSLYEMRKLDHLGSAPRGSLGRKMPYFITNNSRRYRWLKRTEKLSRDDPS